MTQHRLLGVHTCEHASGVKDVSPDSDAHGAPSESVPISVTGDDLVPQHVLPEPRTDATVAP
jgi:hypothetical protein